MTEKIIVSTPLDADTTHLLDVFCEKGHLTRAEALHGLVDALLVDGKQFIFKEWREQVAPLAVGTFEEMVFDALKTFGYPIRTRRLLAMLNGKVSRSSMFRSLDSLIAAGKVEKLGDTGTGRAGRKGLMYQIKADAGR